jgi:hypothetical protein
MNMIKILYNINKIYYIIICKIIENVDLFYDVFYQKGKDKDLKYIKKGISYIEL